MLRSVLGSSSGSQYTVLGGAVALVLGAVLLACSGSPPTAVVPGADAAGEISVPGLLQLPGQIAEVRYSPGSLDRAARIQQRLRLIAADWSDWTGRPVALGAYVLTAEEWRDAGLDRPFGLPQRVGRAWIALPAEGNPATVALWEQALGGGLPAAAGLPLRGTPAEASSMGLADLLAQRELATGMVELADLVREPVWLRDLVAHVVAGSSFRRWDRERVGEVAGLYRRAAAAHPRGELAVAVPEQPLGPWLAWQARLWAAAEVVLAEDGDKAARKLVKMRRRAGAPLAIGDLVERYPGLAEALAQ